MEELEQEHKDVKEFFSKIFQGQEVILPPLIKALPLAKKIADIYKAHLSNKLTLDGPNLVSLLESYNLLANYLFFGGCVVATVSLPFRLDFLSIPLPSILGRFFIGGGVAMAAVLTTINRNRIENRVQIASSCFFRSLISPKTIKENAEEKQGLV